MTWLRDSNTHCGGAAAHRCSCGDVGQNMNSIAGQWVWTCGMLECDKPVKITVSGGTTITKTSVDTTRVLTLTEY